MTPSEEFGSQGADSPSLLRELWQFLGHTRKWWLLPILIVLLLFALLLVLSSSGAAPFLYTLY
jgi:hypothetical protein